MVYVSITQSGLTLCDPLDYNIARQAPLPLSMGILQARLYQYVNRELSDVQAGLKKGRGTRDQIANTCWIIEKARAPDKHLLLLY